MKPTVALGQQRLPLQKHWDTEYFAPFLTLAKRLQKPFFLSWVLKVSFIKVSLASMMILFTASTPLYFFTHLLQMLFKKVAVLSNVEEKL